MTVTVKGALDEVSGKKLVFSLTGHDGMDLISQGTHERYIINAARFNERAKAKSEMM